jgi:hypothetical protein
LLPGVAKPPEREEDDGGVDWKDDDGVEEELRAGPLPFRLGIAIAFEPDISLSLSSFTLKYS